MCKLKLSVGDGSHCDVPAGLTFSRTLRGLNSSGLRPKSQNLNAPSIYNAELPQSILWPGPWQCNMDMLLVFEVAAPIAPNTLLQSVDENEDGLEYIETETECGANDGAVAETVPEEEQLDYVLYT